MASPAFWRGYLKLSLVTCPVTMTPATTAGEKIRFHTVNRATGHRVRSRYVDAETGKPVKQADEAKGYETAEGEFVTFTDEELESVELESVRTIDIERFVKADTIPWIYHDAPYYVTPSDKVGEEAFAVIRQAMAQKKVVGIARLVLFRRERAVMLEPRGNGIVLWTLRYGDEVREADAYFENPVDGKTEPRMMKLIKQVIDERSRAWDPAMVQDPVQDRLKTLIAGKRPRKKTSPEKGDDGDAEGGGASNVVSLMDALKASVEKSGGRSGRKT